LLFKKSGEGIMNVLDFYQMKKSNKKISIVTCYDYSSARIVSNSAINCLLVGDSLAMTMHGFKNTLSATLEMMILHTAAVARGCSNKFIIGDLPFLSYRKSLAKSMMAVEKLIQAGANAVKLEGANGNLELINHITTSGVPVMGHLGLTPQHINMLGGYKRQGKTSESIARLKKEALSLQDAGCFAIVLECVPNQIAKEITELLSIATIGIGAGPDTDGQVLVFQDLLGLNIDFQPNFAKAFINGHEHFLNGINSYVHSINNNEFPIDEDCY
jgi:3-methyl-2-oxobutanoate hydroxymethyltransferase